MSVRNVFIFDGKKETGHMAKKEEYKEKNLQFIEETALQEGVVKLPCGVLYKELLKGSGTVSPELSSVVSVHYRGTLINGREFDNSWKRGCPEAFRLNQVIEGWQQALRQMHVGDRWMIYIPYTLGYGSRSSGPIPGFSTLVFEVELLSIA
jgi:peptidyl-prolyl cis-trans isomerase